MGRQSKRDAEVLDLFRQKVSVGHGAVVLSYADAKWLLDLLDEEIDEIGAKVADV